MGDFLIFERFVWMDRQVRQKRYPNARKLAERFELSCKTAQRNIAFMRDRLAEPHHLQHYMASWVLIARCRLRNDWRKLYLARMSDFSIQQESFVPRPPDQWQHLLEGAFGIFQAPETVTVALRFNPFRARWIREQHWHPDQTITHLDDGGLELSFPVADFREVKLKILQFGADVEVVAPEELRREVQEEVEKMVKLYQKK